MAPNASWAPELSATTDWSSTIAVLLSSASFPLLIQSSNRSTWLPNQSTTTFNHTLFRNRNYAMYCYYYASDNLKFIFTYLHLKTKISHCRKPDLQPPCNYSPNPSLNFSPWNPKNTAKLKRTISNSIQIGSREVHLPEKLGGSLKLEDGDGVTDPISREIQSWN